MFMPLTSRQTRQAIQRLKTQANLAAAQQAEEVRARREARLLEQLRQDICDKTYRRPPFGVAETPAALTRRQRKAAKTVRRSMVPAGLR